jgi:antitoxin VapB
VIQSRKPSDWTSFFAARDRTEIPADFLGEKERRQGAQDRDPLLGWTE